MRVGLRPSRRWGRPERLTAALGAAAVATFIAAVATETGRVFRRASEQALEGPGEPEGRLGAAGQATRDTVAVAVQGYGRSPSRENALFNLLVSFVVAFSVVRVSTWGIRDGWWPLRNLNVGGRHIHHFLPGMLIAFAAGGIALTTRNERIEPLLAIPFGAGLGLTFDEFALLLDLDDVYWTREGLVSIQISAALAAVLGAIVLALRIVRRGEAAVLD